MTLHWQLNYSNGLLNVYLTTLLYRGENVVNTCQISEINPSEPYVPTGATINRIDDNHCKGGADVGLIVGIVFAVIFTLCCCCMGVALYNRRRTGQQTTKP